MGTLAIGHVPNHPRGAGCAGAGMKFDRYIMVHLNQCRYVYATKLEQK